MTPSTRQTYLDRITNPATPEKLRKFYARMLESERVVPSGDPQAFTHFLKHLTEEP